MVKSICVYSSSSDAVDPVYLEEAREVSLALAADGWSLVYGAGAIGLMGECARAFREAGSRVTGVIPDALHRPGIVYEHCDELVVTETMRQRKAHMENSAGGFLALPGGFGTLEELLEIITLKQLKYHNKPVVIYNTAGFYDGLLGVFDQITGQRFAGSASRELYHVAASPGEVVDYLNSYRPAEMTDKWTGISGPEARRVRGGDPT